MDITANWKRLSETMLNLALKDAMRGQYMKSLRSFGMGSMQLFCDMAEVDAELYRKKLRVMIRDNERGDFDEMILEEITDKLLGLSGTMESNVERVVVRDGKLYFITACEVTECEKLKILREKMVVQNSMISEAKGYLEEGAAKLAEGRPKKILRKAYKALCFKRR